MNNSNNSSNNNSSQNLLNNRNSNNKTKLNQASALVYLKTDINDRDQNNVDKNNNKVYLGDQGLLIKQNLLCNQSTDFCKVKNNILKNTFDREAAKLNKLRMLNDNSNFTNIVTIKTSKDEYQLIKESITNNSTNNESKYRKGKITIDSKNSIVQTINNTISNGYQGVRSYCPEEIHFYYVNMVQEGRKFEKNIEGE